MSTRRVLWGCAEGRIIWKSASYARVWNPFLRGALDDVKAIREELKEAADHFPVSCDLDL